MKTTEVYKLVTSDIKKINLLRGGARSSKTHSLIQMSVRWLMEGYIGDKHIPKGTALILRETFPALRRTVLSEFKQMMHKEGFMPFVDWRRSFHEFEYQGRQITFMSLDEESKVLGMQTAWFWINEGNPVQYGIFQQILIRCENFCFLDYNPFDEDGWINQELEIKRLKNIGDVSLNISTYKMNPYLPQPIIDEIELLEETDNELYQVYNKGNWAKVRGLIFPKWDQVEYLPVTGRRAIGIDFGFTHPMTAIECIIINNDLYINELFYERNKLTGDLAEILIDEHGPKIADSENPGAIYELKKLGVRSVKPARKLKNSVRLGINIMKSYNIKVTSGSVNIIQELRRYKWKEDTNGNVTEEPIKNFDHALDAVRYATQYIHKKNRRKSLF